MGVLGLDSLLLGVIIPMLMLKMNSCSPKVLRFAKPKISMEIGSGVCMQGRKDSFQGIMHESLDA